MKLKCTYTVTCMCVCVWVCVRGCQRSGFVTALLFSSAADPTMIVSTENAAPPQFITSRNSDLSVSRGTSSNWDFGWACGGGGASAPTLPRASRSSEFSALGRHFSFVSTPISLSRPIIPLFAERSRARRKRWKHRINTFSRKIGGSTHKWMRWSDHVLKNQIFWSGKAQSPAQCKDLETKIKTHCGTPQNAIKCENAPINAQINAVIRRFFGKSADFSEETCFLGWKGTGSRTMQGPGYGD